MPSGDPIRLPSDPIVRNLATIYEKAERRLQALIEAAAQRGAKGSEAFYRNQQAQVASILRNLERMSRPLESAATGAAYRGAVGAIDRSIDRSKAFSGVHVAAEEVMAANLADRLRYARERVGRQVNDAFRTAALEDLSVTTAAGLSPRQQARSLEDRLRRDGLTSFVDRAGRRWKLAAYARMVARTTTREASSVGMKNRMLEYGFDLVKISEHRFSCPICRPFQGNTYSLTGHDPTYPELPKLPPFHPNCRHVLLPAPVTFEEIERELGLAPPESFPEPETFPGREEEPPGIPTGVVKASDRVTVDAFPEDEKVVRQSLDSIEKVHSFPEGMTTVPIRVHRIRQQGTLGQYHLVFDPMSHSWEGEEIEVDTGSLRDGQDSTVHELGHFLDGHFFGREITPQRISALRRGDYATGSEPEFRDWLDAVKASPQFNRIAQDLTSGASGRRARAQYLLDTRELFARSYEQWIALRSGDKGLRAKQLQVMSEGYNPSGPARPDPDYYWGDEDFGPIAEALDRLFSTLGLR